jgi:uncharacterized repeat protein (TIGR03803 family)
VQAVDGNLYGATNQGGGMQRGAAYRIGLDGSFEVIGSFTDATGSSPFGPLLQADDGLLYGTALASGANFGGTIFTIDFAGKVTDAYDFGQPPFFETIPIHGLIYGAAHRSMFGVTEGGGPELYAFDGKRATRLHGTQAPLLSAPTLGPDGQTLYGTQTQSFVHGSVYAWTKAGRLRRIAHIKGDSIDSGILFTPGGAMLIPTRSSGNGGNGQILEIKGF